MNDAIAFLGGPSATARKLGIKAPSVIGWNGRIPAERCPDVERLTDGQFLAENLRPDVNWVRVLDPEWPHPEGRPCIDTATLRVLEPKAA